MSTQYPILDNRPINKWKVTDLKEELKRRNLKINGLKDDLVNRLDEAIRNEQATLNAQKDENSDHESEPVDSNSTINDTKAQLTSTEGARESNKFEENEIVKSLQNDVVLVGEPRDENLDHESQPVDSNSTINETTAQITSAEGARERNKLEDNEIVKSSQNDAVLVGEPRDENLDPKIEPVDSNRTINETTAQLTSAEGARESNKLEENEVLKSLQNDAVLDGEPRDEAFVESSGIANVAVGNLITSSNQKLNDSDITVDNEVLKSSNAEVLENNKVESGTEVLKNGKNDDILVKEPGMVEASVENIDIFPVAVSAQTTSSDRKLQDTNTTVDGDDIRLTLVPSGEKPIENWDCQVDKEILKPVQMDTERDVSYSSNQLHGVSYPSNQVHEVSSSIEFQVKSESISTDTLSFNEKKELKDNLNADIVQLEPEVVCPELMQPLSSENLSHNDIFHRLDDGMPGGNRGFVGEADDKKPRNIEVSHKIVNEEIYTSDKVGEDNKLTHVTITKYSSPEHAAEVRMESSAEEKFGFADPAKEGNSQENKSPDSDFGKMAKVSDGDHLEKINLDQSSADDSMEEDVLEVRHFGSDQNAAEISKKSEPMDDSGSVESGSIDAIHTDVPFDNLEPSLENEDKIASDIPSDKLEASDESKDKIASVSDKRRFQAVADENAPPKRHRRWNGENVKVPEQQSSGVSVTTSLNKLSPAISEKPDVATSDSALKEDALKDRIVPPSAKTPTNSLRIDNFVRPFTLKAVQELLGKTGKVCNFWMDQIKTHCYVKYSTVEESIETRNAVYNLQWPTNVGRLLIADFVDPAEVNQRNESSTQSAVPPASTSHSVVPIQTPTQPTQAPQQGPNKKSEPRHPLSRERPASGVPKLNERLSQAPLTVPEEVDAPTVTLDDLFRKTKSTPRIYYLPLTEEQVAAKVQKKS